MNSNETDIRPESGRKIPKPDSGPPRCLFSSGKAYPPRTWTPKPRWGELAPEQQQRLREGAKRWQELTPEQKERTKQGINRWRALPPEQQEAVKQRRDWYRELPDDRKRELRDTWQGLPEERKQEFRGAPKGGRGKGPR